MQAELGLHSTYQRRLILKIIQQADKHLDADEVYQRAYQQRPSISLSTVYRNLQFFKNSGMIKEHQLDGRRRYYETAPRFQHHHLVCLGCGRIFDFECPSSEKLKSRISREEGFKVTDAEVRLSGYCPYCQEHMILSTAGNRVKSGKEEVR